MSDDVLKSHILSSVLQSPEFKDSKRSQELLQYLADATNEGKRVKELTIGIEFFGKDPTFDPKDDPTVRVQINHLRKKLEHYFLTTKEAHPFVIEIPKGRYAIEFVPTPDVQAPPAANRKLVYALGAAVVVLTAILAGLLLFPRTSEKTRESKFAQSPVWREFFRQDGKPTLIVLGDFFFLYERTQEGTIGNFVRNLNINTPDDYKERAKNDPTFAQKYVHSDFTFLRPSASWGLVQILPVVRELPNSYSLKLASQFTVSDFEANNVIFVGSFKTLYTLHKYLHTFGLDYSLSPNKFTVRDPAGTTAREFSPKDIKGGSYEKDYAVVAKGAGPAGTAVLLLLGFADTGVLEATRAVTDQQMLGSISGNTNPAQPLEFTMVVETEGYNQAIFKSEVLYILRRPPASDAISSK